MKREIKFRAKHEESNNWVFGSLFQNEVCSRIMPKESVIIDGVLDEYFTVYEKTVGQFTGLKDRNGVEIYEGDIVNFHYFYEDFIDMGAVEAEKEITAIVEMREFGLFLNNGNEYESAHAIFYNPHEESFEVIGSIHSNPELIKLCSK